MEDFKMTINLKVTPEKVFDALTNRITLWWTEMFEGSSHKHSDVFTVRFGDPVYKTMRTEIIPDSKIVWHVIDSLIAVQGLKNQQEWIGTTIVWEITSHTGGSLLHLTHIGLQPNIECYDMCTSGWQQFTDSLKSFLETGSGKPFRQ